MKKNSLLFIIGIALITVMLGGCGKSSEAVASDNAQPEQAAVESTEPEQVEAAEEEAEAVEAADVAGYYVCAYEEEFEGEMVELTDIVVLNDDNSCEISFQDTISGTYTDDIITLENGSVYNFKVDGDTLVLSGEGIEKTFVKSEQPADTEQPEEAEQATVADGPQFVLDTTDIDGNAVSINDFSDAKLIMVNFWEPWCGPCVREMPDLEKIYEEYQSEGLVILGVFSSTDMDEEAREVMKSCGTTYPILLYKDEMEPFITEYVPTTVLMDRNGIVLTDEPIVGSDSYDGWKKVIEEYINR